MSGSIVDAEKLTFFAHAAIDPSTNSQQLTQLVGNVFYKKFF